MAEALPEDLIHGTGGCVKDVGYVSRWRGQGYNGLIEVLGDIPVARGLDKDLFRRHLGILPA